MRGGAVD